MSMRWLQFFALLIFSADALSSPPNCEGPDGRIAELPASFTRTVSYSDCENPPPSTSTTGSVTLEFCVEYSNGFFTIKNGETGEATGEGGAYIEQLEDEPESSVRFIGTANWPDDPANNRYSIKTVINTCGSYVKRSVIVPSTDSCTSTTEWKYDIGNTGMNETAKTNGLIKAFTRVIKPIGRVNQQQSKGIAKKSTAVGVRG